MPPAVDVDIVNMALISLGEEPLVSIDDAANDPDQKGPDRAVIMRTLFNQTREEVFSLYPWSCLIRRAELAELTTTPVYGPAHAFALPMGGVGDPTPPPYCLRVLDTDLDETWDDWGWWGGWGWGWSGWGTWYGGRLGVWRIEGRSVVTDETAIKVRYVGLVLEVPTYAPHLTYVLHRALAVKAAEALDKGAARIDQMEKQYLRALAVARAVNAQEAGIRTNISTALTAVRW